MMTYRVYFFYLFFIYSLLLNNKSNLIIITTLNERSDIMLHVLEHSIKDSIRVLIVVIILNIIISFFEGKLANKINKQSKFSSLLGAGIGIIPQCGFSIVASDMYQKKKITMGTLIAVFIATSDEALSIMLSSDNKFFMVFPLILSKLIIGFIVGTLVDFIIDKINKPQSFDDALINNEEVIHKGCCSHTIEEHGDKNKVFIKDHFIHPILHSFKIFIYVFIINLLFGTIVHFVGEDTISNFLIKFELLTPLIASLIGLIPNCASSVIITNLYIQGSIGFSSCLAGLITNAGLGLAFLLKSKKNIKQTLLIIGILLLTSLISGYLGLIIENLLLK